MTEKAQWPDELWRARYEMARQLEFGCRLHEVLRFWQAITFGAAAAELVPSRSWWIVGCLFVLAWGLHGLQTAQLAYDQRCVMEAGGPYARYSNVAVTMLEALGEGRYQIGPHLRAAHVAQMLGLVVGGISSSFVGALIDPARGRDWGVVITQATFCLLATLGLAWLRARLWKVGHAMNEGLD